MNYRRKIIQFYSIMLIFSLILITTCRSFKETINSSFLDEIIEYSNTMNGYKKIKYLSYFIKIFSNKEDYKSTDRLLKLIIEEFISLGEFEKALNYCNKITNNTLQKNFFLLVKERKKNIQLYLDLTNLNQYKDAIIYYEKNRNIFPGEWLIDKITNIFLSRRDYKNAELFCSHLLDTELQLVSSNKLQIRINQLEKRDRCIQNQLDELKKRKSYIPKDLDKIWSKLTTIKKKKGINKTGYLFRRNNDIDIISANQLFTGNPTALDVLITFNKALKEKGIDLIVLPVPSHPHIYTYRLLDNTNPELEIWPAYINGMITLLENDVEVLEITDDFRKYKEETLLLMHKYNHHWSSAGIKIAVKELSKRLLRYSWCIANSEETGRFVSQYIDIEVNCGLIGENGIPPAEIPFPDVDKYKKPPTTIETMIQVTDLQKEDVGYSIDPVFLIGDSNVDHLGGYPTGCGFQNLLSEELGFPVPYRGQAQVGGNLAAYLYSKLYSSIYPQPDVIILIIRQPRLGSDNWIMPILPLPDSIITDDTTPEKPKVYYFGGKVISVSTPPNPDIALYSDALTVTEFEVESNLEKEIIQGIHWVMKDHVLLEGADIKKPEFYWFEGSSWVDVMKFDKKLSSIMLINDSDSFDFEQYWIHWMEKGISTNIPKPRTGKEYMSQHKENIRKIKDNPVDILLLGDLIIKKWENQLWQKYIPQVHVINWGIEEDRIENLIWRVLNGELESGSFHTIILQTGTVNLLSDSAEEISKGIETLVDVIQYRIPQATIIIVGIVSCTNQKNGLQEKIQIINQSILHFANGIDIFYIDPCENIVDQSIVDENHYLTDKEYDLLTKKIVTLVK